MDTGSSATCRRPAAEAFSVSFCRHGVSTELKTEHHLGINESNAHIAAGEAGLAVQAFAYSLKPALAAASWWRSSAPGARPLSFSRCLCPAPSSRPGSASLLTGWRRFSVCGAGIARYLTREQVAVSRGVARR